MSNHEKVRELPEEEKPKAGQREISEVNACGPYASDSARTREFPESPVSPMHTRYPSGNEGSAKSSPATPPPASIPLPTSSASPSPRKVFDTPAKRGKASPASSMTSVDDATMMGALSKSRQNSAPHSNRQARFTAPDLQHMMKEDYERVSDMLKNKPKARIVPQRIRNPADIRGEIRGSLPVMPNLAENGGREHYEVEPTLTSNLPGYGPFRQFIANGNDNLPQTVEHDARRLRNERFNGLEGTNLAIPADLVHARAIFDQLTRDQHDIGLVLERLCRAQARENGAEIAGENLAQDFPVEAADDAPPADAPPADPTGRHETADESVFRKSFPHGWHTVPADLQGKSHGLNAIVESWKHQYPALSPIRLRDLQSVSASANYGVRDGDYTFEEIANIFSIYIQGRTKRNFELRMFDEAGNKYVSSRDDAKADCLWIYLENSEKNVFRALHPLSYREGQVMSKVQINAFRVLQTTRDQWTRFTGTAANFPDYEAYFNVRIPGLKSFVGETSDATYQISKELLVWLADYLRLLEATSHVKEMARTLGGWWSAFMDWAKRAGSEASELFMRQCRRLTYQNVYDSVQQGADWASRYRSSIGIWFAGNLFLAYRGAFDNFRNWDERDWIMHAIQELLSFIFLQWLTGNNGMWIFLKDCAFATGRFIKDQSIRAYDIICRAAVSTFTTLCDLRLVLTMMLVSSLLSLLAWTFREQLLILLGVVHGLAAEGSDRSLYLLREKLLPRIIAFLVHPVTQVGIFYILTPSLIIGTIWYLMRKYKINPFTWTLGFTLSSLPRPDRTRTIDDVVDTLVLIQRPWEIFRDSVERAAAASWDMVKRSFATVKRFFVALCKWFLKLFTHTSEALVIAYRSILKVIVWIGSTAKASVLYLVDWVGRMLSGICKTLVDLSDGLVDLPWWSVTAWLLKTMTQAVVIAIGVWLALRFGLYPHIAQNSNMGFLPSLGKLLHNVMDHYEQLRQEQHAQMLQHAMERMEGMIRGSRPSKPVRWFW